MLLHPAHSNAGDENPTHAPLQLPEQGRGLGDPVGDAEGAADGARVGRQGICAASAAREGEHWLYSSTSQPHPCASAQACMSFTEQSW